MASDDVYEFNGEEMRTIAIEGMTGHFFLSPSTGSIYTREGDEIGHATSDFLLGLDEL